MVTDLQTVDEFVGSTVSRLLVAVLTVIGVAVNITLDALAVGVAYPVCESTCDFFHNDIWESMLKNWRKKKMQHLQSSNKV